MSDSVRPQRRQPTRLPCPWDSPGKNTGVGCHFLLQYMKVKSEVAQSLSRVRLLATPWTAAYQAPPSIGFSRQEYWSGVPLPSPGLCNRWPHFPFSGKKDTVPHLLGVLPAEKVSVSHSAASNSLGPHGLQPARLLCSCDSPGKNTGMVCHSLLQGSS